MYNVQYFVLCLVKILESPFNCLHLWALELVSVLIDAWYLPFGTKEHQNVCMSVWWSDGSSSSPSMQEYWECFLHFDRLGRQKMNPMPAKKLRNVSKRKGKMWFQLSSIRTLASRWSIHISHQTQSRNPRFWHTSKWRSSTSQSLFCCPDLPDRGHCRRTSPDLTTCTILSHPAPSATQQSRTEPELPEPFPKKTQSQLGLGGTTPNTVQQIERSVLACKSPAGFPSP